MRFARARWVLVTGLTQFLASTVGAADVHNTRGEALRLYEQGRFVEALPLFDEVIKHRPRDIDALNKRGCIYLRINQPARALPDFNAAANFVPFLAYDAAGLARQFAPDVAVYRRGWNYLSEQLYPSAFTNRGIAMVMLGRDDEALADFRHAIDLRLAYREPFRKSWREGLACSYCGVGQVNYRRGNYDLALDAFNTAVRTNPDDPNGFVGRGETEAGLGRFEDALNDYNEALRLDPNHSRAYGFRAATLAQTGRTDAALADYESALRLDPSLSTVRRLRGALLHRLGRDDEALQDLSEATRNDPKDAGALKDRGGIYNQSGDYAKALRDLDESIRLNPNNPKAYQNRSATYNGLGRYADALRDGDEAIRLDPRNAGARNNRGLALIGLGRYESAVADLTEAIRLSPGMACAYLNRGGAFGQLGRYDEAAADYSDAARLEPKLAALGAGSGGFRDLVRIKARLVEEDYSLRQGASAARLACGRGNVLRASGDWAGATAEYGRALEADPRSADALALRGWAKLCAGERGADADARAWFGVSGWRDPFAPYMALLGVLAARSDGREYASGAFLDEASANTRPPGWPSPIFRYLKREVSADDLVSMTADADERALARTVIGFDLLLNGERDAALGHLRWVRDEGSGRSIARDLARETLRRAEGTPRPH